MWILGLKGLILNAQMSPENYWKRLQEGKYFEFKINNIKCSF